MPAQLMILPGIPVRLCNKKVKHFFLKVQAQCLFCGQRSFRAEQQVPCFWYLYNTVREAATLAFQQSVVIFVQKISMDQLADLFLLHSFFSREYEHLCFEAAVLQEGSPSLASSSSTGVGSGMNSSLVLHEREGDSLAPSRSWSGSQSWQPKRTAH